jgi:hypothetical protein
MGFLRHRPLSSRRCIGPATGAMLVNCGGAGTAQGFHRFLCLRPSRSATVSGFFETSGEFFGVWELVKPVVPAFRERFVAKTFCANLEKAAQRYEKWIEDRSPGHIVAMREFMKQMSAQLAKAA